MTKQNLNGYTAGNTEQSFRGKLFLGTTNIFLNSFLYNPTQFKTSGEALTALLLEEVQVDEKTY